MIIYNADFGVTPMFEVSASDCEDPGDRGHDRPVLLAGQRRGGEVPEVPDLTAGAAGGLGEPPPPQHHLLQQVHLGGLPRGHGDPQQQQVPRLLRHQELCPAELLDAEKSV